MPRYVQDYVLLAHGCTEGGQLIEGINRSMRPLNQQYPIGFIDGNEYRGM
jgi:hypothetical protein